MTSHPIRAIGVATSLVLAIALLAVCDPDDIRLSAQGSFQHFAIRDNGMIAPARGNPDAIVNAAGDLSGATS